MGGGLPFSGKAYEIKEMFGRRGARAESAPLESVFMMITSNDYEDELEWN